MVRVQPCVQMVVAMFACVTLGLTTPGVRARSAWYGPLLVELGGLKYATASSSTAPATNRMRIDMRRGCVACVRRASCPTWTRPSRERRYRRQMLTTDQKGTIAELAITPHLWHRATAVADSVQVGVPSRRRHCGPLLFVSP